MTAKNVVITGSTRGIGHGLAREFLQRGCAVVVSGRSAESTDKAVAALTADFPAERVLGAPCDVSSYDSVAGLWEAAVGQFDRVDVWINNAGVSAPRKPLWEVPSDALREVVATNLLGVIHGSQVALRGMITQGSGQLWNMEGFGSGGQMAVGIAPYGATKSAVTYLTKALLKDAKGMPVQIGTLSPGIVLTDLLLADYDDAPERLAKAKKIFNILGDRVETVTPWLVEQVLATQRTGAEVAWLTKRKAFGRFATAAFAKRDLFADT